MSERGRGESGESGNFFISVTTGVQVFRAQVNGPQHSCALDDNRGEALIFAAVWCGAAMGSPPELCKYPEVYNF